MQITTVVKRTLRQRGIWSKDDLKKRDAERAEYGSDPCDTWYAVAEDDARTCSRPGEGATEGEARHNAMSQLRIYLKYCKERDE